MSEYQQPYVIQNQLNTKPPMLITGDDWRYNMLLRLEQQAQAGLMLIIDPDARCWFEVGRMECNKADRQSGFSFQMQNT